jgi:putative serine protease PepD
VGVIGTQTTIDSGAYIESVVSGSPAEKAGLTAGDVVTKIDSTSIASAAQMIINIRGHLVNDKIKLDVLRGGQTLSIEIALGSDTQSPARQ